MIPWINLGALPGWLDVKKIEQQYSETSGGAVRLVGQFAVLGSNGDASNECYPIFWQEKLLKPEHSHYFGMMPHRWSRNLFIFDGSSAAEGYWYGAMHPETGEVVVSTARWNYRTSRDGRVMRDGGRGPGGMRSSGFGVPVRLKIEGYRLKIIDVGQWSE